MKKFIGIFLTSAFIFAVLLSEYDSYYGSWLFYALGMMMVALGYIYKGEENSTSCFWVGLFIMLITFVGTNVSGKISVETIEILRETLENIEE